MGIQTSADHIYHLKRLGKDRYSIHHRRSARRTADHHRQAAAGRRRDRRCHHEAACFRRRCQALYRASDRYPSALPLLRRRKKGVSAFHARGDGRNISKAWSYLCEFEGELRRRDSGKNDSDAKWFGYIYPKNLDKQEVPKLLVPRLVARLACFADDHGRFYCDNVDVGGVVPRRAEDIWLLAGVLNAPVTNTIFSWISKPFRGDYKSANKQFIAPLPMPKVSRKDRAALSALAKGMQERRTRRVSVRADLDERLGAIARINLPLERILPGVRPVATIEDIAPRSVPPAERKAWVDAQRAADEEAALARIDGVIHSSFRTGGASGARQALLPDRRAGSRAAVRRKSRRLTFSKHNGARWRSTSSR